MASRIELYDLASRGPGQNRCWSFNVWKTRLALNYKGMDYETIWLNHNNLAEKLTAIGVPENKAGGFPFTVPTIRLHDGNVVTDSAVIAEKLEEICPSHSLYFDKELQQEAEKIIHGVAMPMFAIYMPRAADRLVPEQSIAAFRTSREKRFGMSLAEMEEKNGGEKAWKAVQPALVAMKDFLGSRKADQALLHAFRQVGEDAFERMVAFDASFGELYDAASEWLQRKD